MKTHMYLVLLALIVMLPVSGCQEAATERTETWAPEESAAAVSVAATAPDVQPPAQFTTIRRRNPETGRIETVRVPVRTPTQPETQPAATRTRTAATRRTTSPAELQPAAAVPAPAAARSRAARAQDTAQSAADAGQQPTRFTTQRRRNPETGRIETVRVPVMNKVRESWEEVCTVQNAYKAVDHLLYRRLRLDKVINPRTGNAEDPQVDYMSAVLKARSAIGVVFDVTILMDSADACILTITATSRTQSEEFLKTHTEFLKKQISKRITEKQMPSKSESVSFPVTVTFDHTIDAVSEVLTNWSKDQGFRSSGIGSDKYYRTFISSGGSNIRFEFSLRLVKPNKTILEIDVSNFEDKEEFPMIRQSLKEALAELKTETGDGGQEQ